MRVVVTGASGNIGTAVLRVFQGRGLQVQAVARRPPHSAGGGVTWTPLDLADPGCLPVLRDLVEGSAAVVNLAWAFQPMRRRGYLRRACVEVLQRVARVVLATDAAQLVHVSSVAAYSPRRSPARVDEQWPREGIPGATYSQLKVEAEQVLLSETRAAHAWDRVAVLRPCLVGQYAAGGPMLRCGLPALLPSGTLRRLPAVPVDGRFGLQMVHADDVADAIMRVVEQRAVGAFNLAAEPLVRGRDIATAVGGRPVPVPQGLARALVEGTWHAHLHPLDPGWVDMALQAPWVDSGRAHTVLGWHPVHTSRDVLEELVRGMAIGAGADTGALRPRKVADGIRRSITQGSVARRTLT